MKKTIIKKATIKVAKVDKEKVLSILREATTAWDVYPRGTIDSGKINKLADDILCLLKK